MKVNGQHPLHLGKTYRPKKLCFAYLHGHCKRGERCAHLHFRSTNKNKTGINSGNIGDANNISQTLIDSTINTSNIGDANNISQTFID